MEIVKSFLDLEIFLTSDTPFHYVSGGVGPYYIDLRRAPNNPEVFRKFLNLYSNEISSNMGNLMFVGVPTTGVIYATGLSLLYKKPLAIIEKLNPERMYIFENSVIEEELEMYSKAIRFHDDCAYLGLEDMGVVFATGLGLKHNRPSAILRRVQKGHGTSKTIEANLQKFHQQGIKTLVIINDPYNPLSCEEILETIKSVRESNMFTISITTLREKPKQMYIKNNTYRFIEIEDLWTTGTSAIMLHQNIKKLTNANAEVLVFLDREQHAMQKFNNLNIDAKSVYKITTIADYLYKEELVDKEAYHKVMEYVSEFKNRPCYSDQLLKYNETSVCVGLDITPGKFPDKPEDTTLPNYPYPQNASGVKQYCLDLLDEIVKVPGVRVIKPNLAYYNSFSDPELHTILQTILERAKALDLLVILDAKIGDIMRTQSQYAEKYKHFDAVTVHGYMGADSVFPVTDTQLGCYVLVFTSNPTRTDLETKSLLDGELLDEYMQLVISGVTKENAKLQIEQKAKKIYHQMTQHIIDWQYAGSVGAVIGGTPNKEGKLQELEEIIKMFAEKLNYLPPILIPGVGTQGGSAKDIMYAIMGQLSNIGWDKEKIIHELRKVVINSSSAINYSPRPKDATQDLVDEIQEAISSFFG